MIKTVTLSGAEQTVTGLERNNTLVINNSDSPIYASRKPNVEAFADDVIEIPAGAHDTVVGTYGTVYLLGSGRVELRGVNYVGFKRPSASSGAGGAEEVTKTYVDDQDNTILSSAKEYTDEAIDTVADDIADLMNDMATAQTAISANSTAIAAAQSTADNAQTTADAAQTAINTLNGTGVGSVSKAVSDGIAEVVAGAPESFDTLKEMSDWISAHSDSAAEMNSQIQTNAAHIETLKDDKADKTEIPTTLPANGGNADTVNNHTVKADVPENAKFTDTVYTLPTASGDALGGIKTGYSQNNKNYPVQLSDGRAYVNVPWTETDISGKMDKENPTGTGKVSIGEGTTASGDFAVAFGYYTTAKGNVSTAEGFSSKATGDFSHAEGSNGVAGGIGAHAEGRSTTANGEGSHAEGNNTSVTVGTETDHHGLAAHAEGIHTTASGNGAHAEGGGEGHSRNDATQTIYTTASGAYSHAEGRGTLASGYQSHAEGYCTVASGNQSHAEGYYAVASGSEAHAEGGRTAASGAFSHTEGYDTFTISGHSGAHAEGGYCTSEGQASHAQGWATYAAHDYSFAAGNRTITGHAFDTVLGLLNVPKSDSLLTIGYGNGGNIELSGLDKSGSEYNEYGRTGATLKNVFRVNTEGAVYGVGAFNTSGADYAEYIKPWFDNNTENEDRRGYFVTIKDGKLHKAESGDYIVGITSGNPSVVGNGDEDWLGRWQRDEFNELIYEDIEVDDYEERDDGNGSIVSVKVGSHIEKQTVQNPDYDPAQPYIERKDRPEWSYVGMVGILPLRDDGTCTAGGFAKCGAGGIATAADVWECHKTFFVIERINGHIISVEMR